MERVRPVRTIIDSSIPEPYQTYIQQRNTHVAQHIAALVGGKMHEENEEGEHYYYVPAKPLLQEYAHILGITNENDLFGSVIGDTSHADKAILHETVKKPTNVAPFHSTEFATLIRGSVLPWLHDFFTR